MDDDDDDNQSQDWIKAVDMGGVIHVNNMMYISAVCGPGTPPNFEDAPNELCKMKVCYTTCPWCQSIGKMRKEKHFYR